jgi:hypothetical protein
VQVLKGYIISICYKQTQDFALELLTWSTSIYCFVEIPTMHYNAPLSTSCSASTLSWINITYRALQKYMHEFHADRDYAMCNIQNRSIPTVQLTQIQKLSNKNFQGTGVLKSSQSCQVLQCKVAARQWRCLAEVVSFSGSCSRCLVLSPLPCTTLPK